VRGAERLELQLDGDQPAQVSVEEQQVDIMPTSE
jgi:hypothetical protein